MKERLRCTIVFKIDAHVKVCDMTKLFFVLITLSLSWFCFTVRLFLNCITIVSFISGPADVSSLGYICEFCFTYYLFFLFIVLYVSIVSLLLNFVLDIQLPLRDCETPPT